MTHGLPCAIPMVSGDAGQPRPLVPVTGDSRLLRAQGLGHPMRWAAASHRKGERGLQGARRDHEGLLRPGDQPKWRGWG